MSGNTSADARHEFIRAWYDWQRVALPVHRFRQNRAGAVTLQLEHDLDHLASSVSNAGREYIAGTRWDWPQIASRHLAALQQAETELLRLGLSEDRGRPYHEFVAATRRVLSALAAAPSAAVRVGAE